MLTNGTIVEVFEDPLTMIRKEGNAKIVEHVIELEPGVDQYRVNFIGDDPRTIVLRTIAEKPLCCCLHRKGDNEVCRLHGAQAVHWVGVDLDANRQGGEG